MAELVYTWYGTAVYILTWTTPQVQHTGSLCMRCHTHSTSSSPPHENSTNKPLDLAHQRSSNKVDDHV